MKEDFVIKHKLRMQGLLATVILAVATIALTFVWLAHSRTTYATTTGGSGGTFTNQNNVSFTGAGRTSTYHKYASTIDSGKPVGLMLHFHGDGAADYTNYNKNSALDADGSTGLVQVARDYNMIFVSVKSPASGSYCSSGSPCWWDNGNINSDYVAALMEDLYSKYNIDKTRIWYVGYSGGAQLITQYLTLRHSDLIEAGGAVIFAGGGSPVGDSADPTPSYNLNNVSTSFRQNFRMFWFTGTNDYDDGDGYDSRTDANEGSAWYAANGFTQTGTNFSYNISHDDVENAPAGYFGMITRQRLEAAYPADTTDPTVSITAPTDSTTVSGTINITANASDNVGVTRVEFYRGATLLGTDNSSPYSYSWDTTAVADGAYALTARAYDAADNNATSSAITVTVDNTPPADITNPTVSVTAPANGSTISGTVNVTANASDNIGVTSVQFLVDGAVVATDMDSPYSTSVDTATLQNGSHIITARAYDAAGNNATSSVVNVTVDNIAPAEEDTTAPTVSITTPANGANVSGNVNITAEAADNVGVSRVEFYRFGTKLGEDTSAPYSYSWDTTASAGGDVTLTAWAYDAAGNHSTSAEVTVSVNNTVVTPPVESEHAFTVPNKDGATSSVTLSGVCDAVTTSNALSTTPQNVDSKQLVTSFGFTSDCASNGGSVVVVVDLGKHYDTATLRVFKEQSDGTVKDITELATFGSVDVDGVTHTTITYSVVDGGDWDKDGSINGTIVDPIYIVDTSISTGGLGSGSTGDNSTNSGTLADTGVDMPHTTLIATGLTVLGLAGLLIFGRTVAKH